MPIDPIRLALVYRAFQNLPERSQIIVEGALATSREEIAAHLGIVKRTVDRHLRRFFIATALDGEREAEAYLAALLKALALDEQE